MAEKRRKDDKGRVLRKGEYQRANGTYAYDYKNSLGKRETVYAPTLVELRKREDLITKDVLDGIDTTSARLTVNDLYERWKPIRALDVKAGILRERTFYNYCYMYEMFVMPSFGLKIAKDVTSPMVSAFYKTLITERGLKPNSIANVHVPLTQVLDYGVDSRILRYNPCHGVMRRIAAAYHRKKTGLPPSKKALTIAQEELFLDCLKNKEKNRRWYPSFAFMLKTGLRVGEFTGLTLPDIDRDLRQIDVNHTLVYYNTGGYGCKGGSVYSINDTKTPAGMRILPMLDEVDALLDEEIERQRQDHIRSRMVIDGYRDFVFLNRFGDVLNEGTLNKALKRIIRDCNLEQMEKGSDLLLPNFSCHWLRHTFSTRMVESDLHDKARMYLMGHESLDTTDTIYTDAQPEFLRREMEKMAA